MLNQIKKTIVVVSAMLMFILPLQSQAAEIKESPSAAAMVFDGIIVRPITLVATVIGGALWIVTLPFSLLGGNAGEAGETLVLEPAAATFLRCLGCTNNGRKIEFDDED
ncbi:MAG: hypothetical protein ACI843_001509 [Psychrobacter glaciei]|jgi:hypothetical protein